MTGLRLLSETIGVGFAVLPVSKTQIAKSAPLARAGLEGLNTLTIGHH